MKKILCLGLVLCLLCCGCTSNSSSVSDTKSVIPSESNQSSTSLESEASSTLLSSEPLSIMPSEELIKEVYGDFYWIADAPYPESFDEDKENVFMLEFAFDCYRKGFNGKTIDDFPVCDEKMDVHEAPASDIINCLSAYFDGIDCEKAVKSWSDFYDPEKDTVKNTNGIGGAHCYIVLRNTQYDAESGLLTTEVCQFVNGVPADADDSDQGLRNLIDSGFDDYESYIFKVKFFADGHWRYLSYEKIKSAPIDSTPLATKPSEELIKKVYGEFIGVTDEPYPEIYEGFEARFVRFAFLRYKEGFNGITIDDFPIAYTENSSLHEAPASDIINCLSAYFDGIDCEKVVKNYIASVDSTKADTCPEYPVGSSYSYYYFLQGSKYDAKSGILSIKAFHFMNGLPESISSYDDKGMQELIDSGYNDYETRILKVKFFADGHWQYLSYEKK